MESMETARMGIRQETTAADLLKRCRAFYEDPENERAFEEGKNKKAAGAATPAEAPPETDERSDNNEL